MPVRPESPALETSSRKAIEAALRELVGKKALYQNVEIDMKGVEDALKPVGEHFLLHYDGEKKKRGMTGAQLETSDREGLATWEKRRISALAEIGKRPWKIETHHFGDDPQNATIHLHARVGIQPLGTPQNEQNLHFYVRSVQLYCGHCKEITSFGAHVGSSDGGFGNPFASSSGDARVQVFLIFYRCEICRERIHSVLVLRRGLKLHLCGFAPRKEQKPVRKLPKQLTPILNDAENAVAEGDLFGGFYHARTLLEHYLKNKQKLELKSRLTGEELIKAHYETLPNNLSSALPSLMDAFTGLSEHLHARTGETADFVRLLGIVCDHIETLAVLEGYHLGSV